MSRIDVNSYLESIRGYGKKLDNSPEFSVLSDQTGFSPETVELTVNKIKSLKIEQDEWNRDRLFSGSSETLTKLMGVMLDDIPEIKNELSEIRVSGNKIVHASIGGIIADWVSGREIPEISRQYFGGEDVDSIKRCVTAIYGKIANYATWGLSAIQKMPFSGIDHARLTHAEGSRIRNLPAMVYYGVGSDEAILMRMNDIPRGIAGRMGKTYMDEHKDSIYDARSHYVAGWLNDLDDARWQSSVPRGKKISGSDYKRIWQTISGIE